MAERSAKPKIQVGRKGLLALVLSVVMLVLVGRMLLQVYEEGDKICDALQAQMARKPGKRMPCREVSYPIAPFNPVAMTASDGDELRTNSVEYQFSDGGDLRSAQTDLGNDDTVDVSYDCSMLGKLLMPLVNYDAWIGYSTYEALAGTAKPAPSNVAKEGSAGVSGFHTELTAVGDPSIPWLLTFRATTRGEDGRLLQQVSRGAEPGNFTVTAYEYDAAGDLVSSRQTTVRPPYSFSRRTDYSYECWDEN